MTVFGRDTLITCLQTMLLGPELAIARSRRSRRSRRARTTRRSTPSRARSSTSCAAAGRPRRGSARTTGRSTRRRSSSCCSPRLALDGRRRARAAAARARAALRSSWIDDYGDRDGDGFVEYERRTPRGLENQSWKDSGDSQRFHDGRSRGRRSRRPRCRATSTTRSCGSPSSRGRSGDDAALAERLEREAAALRSRFDDALLGRASAAATTRSRSTATSGRVDSLCSNIGHLLWSGIVPPERVGDDRDRLARRRALVGLGRSGRCRPPTPPTTRSATTTAPSGRTTRRSAPGAAREGRAAGGRAPDRAARCSRRRASSTGRCRRCSPASSAARRRSRSPTRPRRGRRRGPPGTPVLLLRLLLGLEPDPRAARAPHDAPRALPSGLGRLELTGVRAFGRSWDVAVDGEAGRSVTRRREIAVLSPVWFPVPPSGYGGIEWIVSLLADGLADAGHDVTLFASGDSRTRAKLAAVFEHGAERADRPDVLGAPARAQLLRAARRLRRHPRPHRADGPRARLAPADAARAHRPRAVDGHPGDSTSRSCAWPRTRS